MARTTAVWFFHTRILTYLIRASPTFFSPLLVQLIQVFFQHEIRSIAADIRDHRLYVPFKPRRKPG